MEQNVSGRCLTIGERARRMALKLLSQPCRVTSCVSPTSSQRQRRTFGPARSTFHGRHLAIPDGSSMAGAVPLPRRVAQPK